MRCRALLFKVESVSFLFYGPQRALDAITCSPLPPPPRECLVCLPLPFLCPPASCVLPSAALRPTKVGGATKRADPSKTGNYGLGFNVVYHLTDVRGAGPVPPCRRAPRS